MGQREGPIFKLTVTVTSLTLSRRRVASMSEIDCENTVSQKEL
jgi:hypothetical protein